MPNIHSLFATDIIPSTIEIVDEIAQHLAFLPPEAFGIRLRLGIDLFLDSLAEREHVEQAGENPYPDDAAFSGRHPESGCCSDAGSPHNAIKNLIAVDPHVQSSSHHTTVNIFGRRIHTSAMANYSSSFSIRNCGKAIPPVRR